MSAVLKTAQIFKVGRQKVKVNSNVGMYLSSCMDVDFDNVH